MELECCGACVVCTVSGVSMADVLVPALVPSDGGVDEVKEVD